MSGLAPDRYVVTCNGRAIPMRPTGREGEFVAGVRYRAWQPSSALHPKIGIHAPLTFDIVDTWMNRSEGGCRYHVVHPGGRSHETFPVNAFEAESRRLARFFRLGHTPGRYERRAGDAERRSFRSPWTCAIIDNPADPRLSSYRSDHAPLRRAVGWRGPHSQPLADADRRALPRMMRRRRVAPPN